MRIFSRFPQVFEVNRVIPLEKGIQMLVSGGERRNGEPAALATPTSDAPEPQSAPAASGSTAVNTDGGAHTTETGFVL